MSLANFKLSKTNPNDSVGGGGCLCKAIGKATGCKGPYAVFTDQAINDPRSPHPVLSLACAQAILQTAERSGEDITSLGAPADMQSALAAQPEPNLDWDELTEDERKAFSAFPPGELISVGAGDRVRVPLDHKQVLPEVEKVPERRPRTAPGEPNLTPDFSDPQEDPLVQLSGENPSEEPGTRQGEYVLAQGDEDVPEV